MLSFLKQLFTLEEEKQEIAEERFTLEDAGAVLSENLSKRLNFYQEKLDEEYKKIDELKSEIAEKLMDLQQSALSNPDAPEQAKQYMHLNREEFIKKIKEFLAKIQRPEILSVNYCPAIRTECEYLFSLLNKRYYILQEFFPELTKKIWHLLEEIANSVHSLRPVYSSANLKEADALANELDQIKNKSSQKEMLEKEINFAKITISEKQKYEKDILTKIEDIKKSQDYLAKAQEISSLQQELKTVEKEILHYFTSIKPLLKKYSEATITNNLIVASYAEKPLQAFQEDLHLKIIGVVDGIKQHLAGGTIVSGEEQNTSVLYKITRELVEQLSKKYVELKTKQEMAMKESVVLQALFEEHKKLENVREEAILLNEKIKELDAEKAKIDLVQMKNEFLGKLNEAFSAQRNSG